MPRQRENPPSPSKRETNMGCDGTAQDYRRHSHRGEEPCAASRDAWRQQCRFYRHTGLYEEGDPERVHPFFYSKPKMKDPGTGATINAKNRKQRSKDPRDRA